jgi:hypothetical protein
MHYSTLNIYTSCGVLCFHQVVVISQEEDDDITFQYTPESEGIGFATFIKSNICGWSLCPPSSTV